MTAFVISWFILAYFFIGGFVSGYFTHRYKASKEAFVTVVLLWPLMVAFAIICKVTMFAALWSQAFTLKMEKKVSK